MHRRQLASEGFVGFRTVRELFPDLDAVPERLGVYAVLRASRSAPRFLRASPAGHNKGKDPSELPAVLKRNWVPGSQVVYIGKAGRRGGRTHLRKRLQQYLRHGEGLRSPHWGGRYVWQLAGARDLLVAWKETPHCEPASEETRLLELFHARHGRLPFANLRW